MASTRGGPPCVGQINSRAVAAPKAMTSAAKQAHALQSHLRGILGINVFSMTSGAELRP
jgi:hypothetical protein